VSIQEKRHSLKTVIDMFAPELLPYESVVGQSATAETEVKPAEVGSTDVDASPENRRWENSYPAEVKVSCNK